MQDIVSILSALAEPTRLAAMRLLWDGDEHCVCELMRKTRRQPVAHVATHGAPSRAAGLVVDRRDAQWVRYRRNPDLAPASRAIVEAVMASAAADRKGGRMSSRFPIRARASTSPAVWIAATARGHRALVRALLAAEEFSGWIVAHLPLPPGSHLEEAARFFAFDTPKVLMLLTLVVFGMGVVRSFFSPERTRALLAGRREGFGNVAAATLGVFTPFCSCSAVPLFVGFVSAGVPLGVTFSFLISAPMVNEVALGLLFALVGWKVGAVYLGVRLTVAIVSGWVIGRLHLEGWLEEWVRNVRAGEASICRRITRQSSIASARDWKRCATSSAASGSGSSSASPSAPSSMAMCRTDLLASIMGKGAWWSVPAVVADRRADLLQRRRHHPCRRGAA